MPLIILVEVYAFSSHFSQQLLWKMQEIEEQIPLCSPSQSLEFLDTRLDSYGCFLPPLDWNSSASSKAECLFTAKEIEEQRLCLR